MDSPASSSATRAATLLERALAQRAAGQDADAILTLREALTLDPRQAEAHHQLGNALRKRGQLADALPPLEEAARLAPANGLIWLNLGVTHLDLDHPAPAVTAFRRAIALIPAMPEAHNVFGCALLADGDVAAARAQLETALRLRPGYAAAHNNLGRTYRAQGRMAEALAHFEASLRAAPSPATHSNFLLATNYVDAPPAEHVARHARWHTLHAQRYLPPPREPEPATPRRRLRVGYVSADFCNHAVAFFIEPVLARHDRTHIEVFCYYNRALQDDVTRRLKTYAEHWRDVATLDDDTLAARITADGIDVLIDLNGHTASNRLLVFARKPAPVQLTWLGYPQTTGLAAIDYRVTDSHCIPASDPDSLHSSERLLRLPRVFCCYQPPDDCPPVHTLPRPPGHAFTYASFNNLAKLSLATLLTWAEILKLHPASRLLLKSPGAADADTQAYIRSQFTTHGVAAERIAFDGQRLAMRQHLELYHGCDLALDPFPYNGTTTTCEALLMGVPVIALAGTTHVSRVSVSLLHATGLDDLVASTPEAYVNLALALARDEPRRDQLRHSLRARLLDGPLGQTKRFTKDWEVALWRVSGRL